MLISTALVLFMVPGLAMFYGGLVRTKNVLSTMMHSFVAMALIGVLWVVCGYSLCFGENILGGFVGWNSDFFMHKGIDDSITDGIPEYIFAMFQGKFAIITPALISGALAERVFFRGYVFFIALWFLFVYCPLCHCRAIILGVASTFACFLALKAKDKFGYDDTLDCFGIHGVGSGLGVVLLAFFIRPSWLVDAAAATEDGVWTAMDQFGVQMLGMGATIGLSAVVTLIICFIVTKTVGFRVDKQTEITGLDQTLHGEHGYGLAQSDR